MAPSPRGCIWKHYYLGSGFLGASSSARGLLHRVVGDGAGVASYRIDFLVERHKTRLVTTSR